jgi:hypothetical protein
MRNAMKKLSYIRFATYALLALAVIWPSRKAHVIPVQLQSFEENVAAQFDSLYRRRQETEDVTRKPGFETTKKSGSEVLRLGTQHVQKDVTDLSDYRTPTITLVRNDKKMKWIVSWERKGMPIPSGFFGVMIDDETGEIEDIPGM